MKKYIKKMICLLSCITIIAIGICGCGRKNKSKETSANEKVPEISISWGNDLHTAVPYVPLKKVDKFKEKGVYLKTLSEDKYELIENDKKLAILNFVPTKGGSEIATLMGQGHLDTAICSNTAILTGIDKGTNIKILCPIQTGGICLVFSPDVNLSGWKEVKEYISNSKVPVKIGYHSPVSGPRIVIESVLKEEGFKVTEDPNDSKADVLLVDLKGDTNLLPSLTSKQVDAWVGPSAFPEISEHKKVGKIAVKLEEFPPKGQWENFPCCVLSAREEVLNKHPEIFKALTHLLKETCDYCMKNREDTAKVLSGFIGIDKEIVKSATINYTTDPSKEWLEGIKVYVDALNKMGKFNGRLKDKDFEEVVKQAFDFSYIKNQR